ncbi:hypothetical protein, partial [uncultured Chryseobacterium sp.]|uniref:hypothetical protein n=1 Tax=uncultured Chryseobacterium sp. TaxID=259322 RepID=UPI00261F9455
MRKIYLIIFLCFLKAQLYSQGIPASNTSPVSFPLSPEAYSLLKFDINPVDLNTGIPDISENLYSIEVDKHITLNLNLKYHPSGIRIKELSGLVGQGWNINASGAITREVNGLPDDKPIYGILDNGYESALAQYGSSHSQTIKYLYDSKYGKEDVEYDLFHFNFLNHSGSFKLNKNGSGDYLGRGGNYKIFYERNPNDADRISKIIIIDDAGYKYIFDKKSIDGRTTNRTLVYEYHGCVPFSPMESTILPPPYTTWYLSEIKNPDDIVICSFIYGANTEQGPDTIMKNINLRLNDLPIHDPPRFPSDYELATGTGDVCGDYVVYCNHKTLLPKYETIVIQNSGSPALTKINIIGKGTIDFNISNYQMESILVKNASNSIIRKIEFDFLNTTNGRRFLRNLVIKDKNNAQTYKYSFEYESPTALPSASSDNYDYWGYFNNKLNTDLIVVGKKFVTDNKWADKNYVTTGVLKKMILPTGGSKEFIFESNTYSKELISSNLIYDVAENRDTKSFHISKPIHNGSKPGIGTPVENNYIYVKDFQKIGINFSASQYQNVADVSAIFVQITPIILPPPVPGYPPLVLQSDVDNAPIDTSRSGTTIQLNNTTSNSDELYGNGYYRISYHHNGNLQYFPVTYDLDAYYYNLVNNIEYLYGGGVRIKQIKAIDGNNIYFKNYDYGNPSNAKQSSGEIINTPIYTKLHSYNWSAVTGINIAGFTIVPSTSTYMSANELGYSSANAIKGSFVNYKNVKVIDDKGKIENIFSVYSDYSDITYDDIFNPTYKFHNQDYKIGLLKENKVYNSTNTLLKSSVSDYEIKDFTATLQTKVLDNNGGCYLQNGPWSSRVNSYDAYISNLNSQPYPSSGCGTHPMTTLTALFSFVKYGFSGVKETKEKEWLGGNVIEKTTTNTYNARDYVSKNTVKFPDETLQETTYKYAHEKGNQLMISKNMIGIPLETETKQTINGTTKTLSKTETVYPTSVPTAQAGNLVLPISVLSFNLQSGSPETEVTFDKYDSKGNLLQYTTKAGSPVAIV